MTDWDDLNTLGIWLGFGLDHVHRLRSENKSVRGAALNILGSFYQRKTTSEAEKWRMIIEALRELGKESLIERLRLNEMFLLCERK